MISRIEDQSVIGIDKPLRPAALLIQGVDIAFIILPSLLIREAPLIISEAAPSDAFSGSKGC